VQQTLAVHGVTLLKKHAKGKTTKYEDLAGKIGVMVRRTTERDNMSINYK
jgi:hypothetical protein